MHTDSQTEYTVVQSYSYQSPSNSLQEATIVLYTISKVIALCILIESSVYNQQRLLCTGAIIHALVLEKGILFTSTLPDNIGMSRNRLNISDLPDQIFRDRYKNT